MKTFEEAMPDELTILKARFDVAMNLLRDNQSPMHFDREMTQADHDILREARKWRSLPKQ